MPNHGETIVVEAREAPTPYTVEPHKRPTIADLEEILNDTRNYAVEILPSGEIRAKPAPAPEQSEVFCWIARDPNGRLYRFSTRPVWSEEEDQWELRRGGDDLDELHGWPANAAPYPGHCLRLVSDDD